MIDRGGTGYEAPRRGRNKETRLLEAIQYGEPQIITHNTEKKRCTASFDSLVERKDDVLAKSDAAAYCAVRRAEGRMKRLSRHPE